MQILYQDRLISRLRAWPQTAQPNHLVALVPPGLLAEAGFSTILESLSAEFTLEQSAAGQSLSGSTSGTPRLVIVPAKQATGPGPQFTELMQQASGQPVFWIAEYPFWFDVPAAAKSFSVSIDNRFFRYNDAELAGLLETAGLGGESLQGLTPHELRALSGAWPGITDAAVGEISRCQTDLDEGSMAWPGAYSIAQFDAVRHYFIEHWLPLLDWRYPWLRELCVLPLVTMDLLAEVFHGQGAAIRECLLTGWLERCPGRMGEYRPEPLLDQLLRVLACDSVDVARIEAAIGWYQRHGCPAEAIESAAFLGMPLERLQQVIQHVAMEKPRRPAAAWLPDPQQGAATGTVVARAGAGVASPGLAAKLSSTLAAGRQQPPAKSATSPGMSKSAHDGADQLQSPAALQGLAQILQAINLHQGYNWAEVSDAVTAALKNGFERQQVNRLVDFVDIHLRPLLDQGSTPLSRAIRNLNHSAPAKATLARAADQLNYRELQILQSIYEGCSNQEISDQFGLKLSTVKWYGTRIYEKLGVRNRTQAALKARKLKLVDY